MGFTITKEQFELILCQIVGLSGYLRGDSKVLTPRRHGGLAVKYRLLGGLDLEERRQKSFDQIRSQ